MHIRVRCVASNPCRNNNKDNMHKDNHLSKLARCQTNESTAACRRTHSVTQGMEHATGGTHGGVELAAWGKVFDSECGPVSSLSVKIPLQHGTRTKLGQPFSLEARILMKGCGRWWGPTRHGCGLLQSLFSRTQRGLSWRHHSASGLSTGESLRTL